MGLKTLPTILRSFSLLIIMVLPTNIFSCGWSESYETTRLALFRASLPGFEKLNNYIYSNDLLMETGKISDFDQKKNCQEWTKKLNADIKIDDVYQILYDTNSETFQNQIDRDSLTDGFEKNTFLIALKIKKNKPFLDYLIVAKNIEYNQENDGKWENWNTIGNEYVYYSTSKKQLVLISIDELITNSTDKFLKERYAFLALRQAFYNKEKAKVNTLYDAFFANKSNSIIKEWAKYYMALGLENKAETNYNLSQILVKSHDKCHASIRNFDDKLENETLIFAKNETEKGIIKSIPLLYNPGPTIEKLNDIALLIPNDKMFAFLVQREVNKIEDWIFSPKYGLNYRSNIYIENGTETDYEKARSENEIKDLKYLKDFKTLLINAQTKTSGEQKDFLNAAIAQLCFINDEIFEGNRYTNMISASANPSIQLQKNVQLSLLTLKQDDIKTEATQENLFQYFNKIENAVENDNTLFKSMYTLYSIASKEYFDKKDVAKAGLLYMKSQTKKDNNTSYDYEYYDLNERSYYDYIGYFDRNAQPKDIDELIDLIKKNNKTDFEKYICSGNITKNIDIYRDLKGTIAFRNNNLELAQKTFSEMDKDFWKNNYEFQNYLNENPFFPKALNYSNPNRKSDYDFNKATFVKEMIQLRDSKSASNYLRLANAYFNVSSFGNAWMMTSYELSGGSYNDYIYGDSQENQKKYGLGNYFNLNIAKKYYQKALQLSKNKEQKAVCSLMIFECDYYNFSSKSMNNYSNISLKFSPGIEIYNFNTIYKDTKVFKKFNCPLLEQFLN